MDFAVNSKEGSCSTINSTRLKSEPELQYCWAGGMDGDGQYFEGESMLNE